MKTPIKNKKLKIVHALAYYGEYLGGLQIYVKELAMRQKKEGHHVKIITSALYGNEKILDGIEIIKTPVLFSAYRVPFTPLMPFKLLSEDCDILHVHLPLPWLDISAFIKKLIHPKTKLIITIHNYLPTNSVYSKLFAMIHNKLLIRLVINKSDTIITTTKQFTESLPFSIPKNKNIIIPLGVDTKIFYPKNTFDKNQLLFVGRLIPEKGLKILIHALEKVKKEFPHIHLLIITADVYNYSIYEKEISTLNFKNYKVIKNVPHEKMRKYYENSSILIMPSIDLDSFGFVQLEAIACGCPVIVTDIPGPNSIITNEQGIVVPKSNIKALSEAIIKLLNNKSISRIKIRKYCVDHYSWEKIFSIIMETYLS